MIPRRGRETIGAGGDFADVVLSAGRVVLRSWTLADAPLLVEASADPAIRRFNGDHDRDGWPAPPLSTARAEARIAVFATRRDALAAGGVPEGVVFLVEDLTSGEPVGCCGVDAWTQEDVAQVGCWLAPGDRGRGHATRALVLLTTWLFGLGAARVFFTVVADNESSAAVARGAGFVDEGTMRAHAVWQGQRRDVLWFAALPSEWEGPISTSA